MSLYNPYNYSAFRCQIPGKQSTGQPWFPYSDVCPCDVTLDNPTGRGRTSCPFGIDFDQKAIAQANLPRPLYRVEGTTSNGAYQTFAVPVENISDKPGEENVLKGSMFPTTQFSAPQAWPRPLVRIGQTWRSAWA